MVRHLVSGYLMTPDADGTIPFGIDYWFAACGARAATKAEVDPNVGPWCADCQYFLQHFVAETNSDTWRAGCV